MTKLSPLAAVIPSLIGTAPGLAEAISAAGFRVSLTGDLSLISEKPAVLVLNVCGLGTPNEWPIRIRHFVETKLSSPWSSVPTIVIDPPEETDWDMEGGYTQGVDAYYRWPGDPQVLSRLLWRLRESVVV